MVLQTHQTMFPYYFHFRGKPDPQYNCQKNMTPCLKLCRRVPPDSSADRTPAGESNQPARRSGIKPMPTWMGLELRTELSIQIVQ